MQLPGGNPSRCDDAADGQGIAGMLCMCLLRCSSEAEAKQAMKS